MKKLLKKINGFKKILKIENLKFIDQKDIFNENYIKPLFFLNGELFKDSNDHLCCA